MTPEPPLPESRFSPPSRRCSHPEWWHSTDDHSTEIEVSELVAGLVRGLQPELVVETGSAWGQTSELIGQALRANGHGTAVSLETDPERVVYARERCADLPVHVWELASLDYVPQQKIDLAFFDSTFSLRIPEFRLYSEWMHAGTVVVFHDTRDDSGGGQLGHYNDLRSALDGELGGELALLHMPTPRGVTIGMQK